jgi:hypothetical protein
MVQGFLQQFDGQEIPGLRGTHDQPVTSNMIKSRGMGWAVFSTHVRVFNPSKPTSPKWSLALKFSSQNSIFISFSYRSSKYMTRPAHVSWFNNHTNKI